MKAKEINETIDRLDDAEWQRMKDHMDGKFPNMAMKDLETFKMLVQCFGLQMEDNEKKLH